MTESGDLPPVTESDPDPLGRLRRRAARAEARQPDAPESVAPESVAPEPAASATALEPAAPEPAAPATTPEPEPAAVVPDAPAVSAAPAAPTVQAAPEPQPEAAAPAVLAPSEPEPTRVVDVPESTGPSRRTRAVTVLVAAAVLAVAATAAAAATTVRFGSTAATASPSDRAAIVSAAVSGVTATATYDYTTLHTDEQSAESQLAEPLKSAYLARMRTQIEPLADKYHVSAKASVDPKFGAGVVKVSGDSAQVLLYVDQVVSNNQLAAPRLDQTRVLATLVDQGGHWRVSGLRTI